jgi:hypothetical protein
MEAEMFAVVIFKSAIMFPVVNGMISIMTILVIFFAMVKLQLKV